MMVSVFVFMPKSLMLSLLFHFLFSSCGVNLGFLGLCYEHIHILLDFMKDQQVKNSSGDMYIISCIVKHWGMIFHVEAKKNNKPSAKCAPTRYKWTRNPYKWTYTTIYNWGPSCGDWQGDHHLEFIINLLPGTWNFPLQNVSPKKREVFSLLERSGKFYSF